jgi:hypothetical protein
MLMLNSFSFEFLFISFGVFLAGAVYEGSGPMYVYWSERNCPVKVGFLGAVQAICQLTGIGTSIHDLRFAPAFVLGYFVGPFVILRFGHWWKI